MFKRKNRKPPRTRKKREQQNLSQDNKLNCGLREKMKMFTKKPTEDTAAEVLDAFMQICDANKVATEFLPHLRRVKQLQRRGFVLAVAQKKP